MAGIREQRATAVEAYVSDVVGCSLDRITAVSRFQDGNRHAVHKVSYLDACDAAKDVVVRVSFDGAPADRAQAEREARVLQRVGGFAAPRLYDFRCASQWFDTPVMCMEFVPGSAAEVGSATPEEIDRLGSVVAALHGRPVDDLAESFGATGDIASYAERRLGSILSGLAWFARRSQPRSAVAWSVPLTVWRRPGRRGGRRSALEPTRRSRCSMATSVLGMSYGARIPY